MDKNSKSVSIIIATWNGKDYLKKYLPSLIAALSSYKGPWEIVVIDDAGEDDTEEFMRSQYPTIKYKKLPQNIGNGQALNRGAEVAKNEILYFLDNDVEVSKDFLDPLLGHFDDPKVFAVGSHSFERPPASKGPLQLPRVKFRYGIFWYYYDESLRDSDEAVPVLFSSAGHCAVAKDKFFMLEGFDVLYGRFYLEDLDLCYRAWKKGWKVLVDPKSEVYHEAAGTISKILSRAQIQRRQWRNRFLFTWKNIHSFEWMLQHLIFLLPEILLLPFLGKLPFSLGLFDAIPHLKKSLGRREIAKKEATITDVEACREIGPIR